MNLNKMNSYKMLTDIVDIDEIKEVYYNNKYKLDLTTTIELMKKTDICDISDKLTFYGTDFKIIKIELEDIRDSFFVKVSLKKPSTRKIFVPFTLDSYKMNYSGEHKEPVPFKAHYE